MNRNGFELYFGMGVETVCVKVYQTVEELVESWTGEHRISVTYQSTAENEEIRHYYQERQKQKKLEMNQAKQSE